MPRIRRRAPRPLLRTLLEGFTSGAVRGLIGWLLDHLTL